MIRWVPELNGHRSALRWSRKKKRSERSVEYARQLARLCEVRFAVARCPMFEDSQGRTDRGRDVFGVVSGLLNRPAEDRRRYGYLRSAPHNGLDFKLSFNR